MKIIHTKSPKTNRFYTALVASDKHGKPVYNFDPHLILLALTTSPLETERLLELYDLVYKSELLTIESDWEIEI